MPQQNPKLDEIRQLLDAAEANLRSAKQQLAELTGVSASSAEPAATTAVPTADPASADGRVIEGVFDGKDMNGPDQRRYPVPANYASKSKLVAGDVLKLTITDDGSYIYKQIGPVGRRKMVGTLTQEGNQYQVLAGGKPYNVLLASVTYFKAQPGDKLSIIVPESGDTDWAAVDNMMMGPSGANAGADEEPIPASTAPAGDSE